MILTDTHTHLYSDQFNDDIDSVIQNCIDKGINRLFLPNIDSNSIDLIINDPPFVIGDDDIGTRYTRCEDNVTDGYVEVPVSKYEGFSYEFMVEIV